MSEEKPDTIKTPVTVGRFKMEWPDTRIYDLDGNMIAGALGENATDVAKQIAAALNGQAEVERLRDGLLVAIAQLALDHGEDFKMVVQLRAVREAAERTTGKGD